VEFRPSYVYSYNDVIFRDAGTRVHYGGTAPCPLKGGATGAQVPLHNSIISNSIILTRSTWNKFIAAIRAHKNQNGFL